MSNELENFIHVGRVLKEGFEGGGTSPFPNKRALILKFSLIVKDICFIPYSLFEIQNESFSGRNEMYSGKIWKLREKN